MSKLIERIRQGYYQDDTSYTSFRYDLEAEFGMAGDPGAEQLFDIVRWEWSHEGHEVMAHHYGALAKLLKPSSRTDEP